MSTERIVADRAVADALAQKLAEKARALPMGDPREPTTAIGPLINRAAVERVFSEDVPAALELAQRIESGICHVNDTTGRFGGRAALEEFAELRRITVQSLPRHYPI
jgi:hypothetical protein